jgi:hypothetical protein
VPDGVCVVWAGLLEKPFEVVCSWARLTIFAIGHGHGPFKVSLVRHFAALDALLGAVGGDVEWRLPAAARGHLPASLGRVKHDCLVADGALGGYAMSALPRALCALLG